MKKLLSIILVAVMMMSMLCMPAFAEPTGEGTKANPVVVSSEEDLRAVAAASDCPYDAVYIKLGADITLTATVEFTIANNIYFDMDGHTITFDPADTGIAALWVRDKRTFCVKNGKIVENRMGAWAYNTAILADGAFVYLQYMEIETYYGLVGVPDSSVEGLRGQQYKIVVHDSSINSYLPLYDGTSGDNEVASPYGVFDATRVSLTAETKDINGISNVLISLDNTYVTPTTNDNSELVNVYVSENYNGCINPGSDFNRGSAQVSYEVTGEINLPSYTVTIPSEIVLDSSDNEISVTAQYLNETQYITVTLSETSANYELVLTSANGRTLPYQIWSSNKQDYISVGEVLLTVEGSNDPTASLNNSVLLTFPKPEGEYYPGLYTGTIYFDIAVVNY